MKKLIGVLLLAYCFGVFGCASDAAAPSPVVAEAPPQKEQKNVVATPSDISRPTIPANNFERIQGEWRNVADFKQTIQIRGKVFVEITEMPKRDKRVSQPLSLVHTCDGPQDFDGTFLKVAPNRCYKILKVDTENLELELIDQQQVTVYKRF